MAAPMTSPFSRAATGAVSVVWSAGSALSRWSYGRGVRESVRLGAKRVISVGNLQAGGSGKTPLVARIAREAIERGLNVCILTRGYGGEWERRGGLLEPAGETDRPVAAELCGDEAALLALLVPAAYVAVGADRVASYDRARARLGAEFDLVILDDGFQHRRVARDLELVAVTSAGPCDRVFREFPSAARRADLVIWTKGDRAPEAFGRPLLRARFIPEELPGCGTQVVGSRPLALVTGVGDPRAVRDGLAQAGYSVVWHSVYRDHARYDRELALRLFDRAREAGLTLALTGKDWVKWRAFGIAPERVRVFEPKVEWSEGGELWSRMLWGT